jgi:hypothetical protein
MLRAQLLFEACGNGEHVARLFVRKPVVVEASQWNAHGDHSEVSPLRTEEMQDQIGLPERRGVCRYCGREMLEHGWINTLEGGHIVCPGDWIIKGIKGEFYACKPDVFAQSYDEVHGDGSKSASS